MITKIKSITFGHAVADAVGVPAEFRSRTSLEASPITDVTGYGTYNMPEGCWSDDTTMSICALDVLADGTVDFDKVMKNFSAWYKHGEFTPTGELFDIGGACSSAIAKYIKGDTPALECGGRDEWSNGNGSLMRVYPFVLYAHYHSLSDSELAKLIADASRLTHGHIRSINGCIIYAFVLRELIMESSPDAVTRGIAKVREIIGDDKHYSRILEGNITEADEDSIKGDGYVVNSLEASLWCLMNTEGYRDCVLKAINLGEDTDTTAAIAGSLAGALYGYDAIPQNWTDALKKYDFIDEMCVRAAENWAK